MRQVLTSRFLTEAETQYLFEWLHVHWTAIISIEEMGLEEIDELLPVWENNSLLWGRWTVTIEDIEVAVLFRLTWGE